MAAAAERHYLDELGLPPVLKRIADEERGHRGEDDPPAGAEHPLVEKERQGPVRGGPLSRFGPLRSLFFGLVPGGVGLGHA